MMLVTWSGQRRQFPFRIVFVSEITYDYFWHTWFRFLFYYSLGAPYSTLEILADENLRMFMPANRKMFRIPPISRPWNQTHETLEFGLHRLPALPCPHSSARPPIKSLRYGAVNVNKREIQRVPFVFLAVMKMVLDGFSSNLSLVIFSQIWLNISTRSWNHRPHFLQLLCTRFRGWVTTPEKKTKRY